MAKYKELDTEKLIYIINPNNKIPQGVLEELFGLYGVSMDIKPWYEKIKECGHLVKLESKVGFMYIVSEYHSSQYSDTEGFNTALAHGKRTIDSVMELLCETATIITEQTCGVYVGNCTGIDNEHELCVFFPYGTDNAVISRTVEFVDKTIKELAFKKWNSLVDVIKYG